jgi:hypothetical protein
MLQVQCIGDNDERLSVLSFTHTLTHTMYAHREERNSLVLRFGLADGCAKKGEKERKDENQCYIVEVAMT